jgi:hypothetical protein
MEPSDTPLAAANSAPVLTREEMEALAADYASGALQGETDSAVRLNFERSLPAYPDLASDVAEMCLLFGTAFNTPKATLNTAPDADDLASSAAATAIHNLRELREHEALHTAQRLRNLTVHVQDRIERQRNKGTRLAGNWTGRLTEHWNLKHLFASSWRVLVPALAAYVVLLVIAPQSSTNNSNNSNSTNTSLSSRLTGMIVEASGNAADYASGFYDGFTMSDEELAAKRASEQALLRPDEESVLRDGSQANAQASAQAGAGILESDVALTGAANAATDNELDARESLAAARMLKQSTLAALSDDDSPFSDRFAGEGALLQTIGDDDINNADVTALLENM